jgi:hypothetical protein
MHNVISQQLLELEQLPNNRLSCATRNRKTKHNSGHCAQETVWPRVRQAAAAQHAPWQHGMLSLTPRMPCGS